MRVSLKDAKENIFEESAVALGFFDGVHIGHAAILKKAASLTPLRPVACTFQEHPKKGRFLLCGNCQKEQLLKAHGMRDVVFLDFDEVCGMSAERFVKEVLIGILHAKAVVCGENYRFGKKAAGDVCLLKALGKTYGIDVFSMPLTSYQGEPVSASRIRAFVLEGKLDEVYKLLGRPYSIAEKVVYGKQLGRTIGIPTINQFPPARMILPAHGVYASRSLLGTRFYPSITNVGVRPTVDDGDAVNFETHIIGVQSHLYGQNIRVDLYDKIRGEIKFSDVNALKAQIMADILSSEEIYKKYPEENFTAP